MGAESHCQGTQGNWGGAKWKTPCRSIPDCLGLGRKAAGTKNSFLCQPFEEKQRPRRILTRSKPALSKDCMKVCCFRTTLSRRLRKLRRIAESLVASPRARPNFKNLRVPNGPATNTAKSRDSCDFRDLSWGATGINRQLFPSGCADFLTGTGGADGTCPNPLENRLRSAWTHIAPGLHDPPTQFEFHAAGFVLFRYSGR